MPRDAETWLAERGVERQSVRLTPTDAEVAAASEEPSSDAPPGAGDGPAAAKGTDAPGPAEDAATTDGPGPDPSAREVVQLAQAQASHAADRAARTASPVGGPSLTDDVAEAVQFLRRSTATAPQSVGRLRAKLADRDTPAAVIDLALERAHAEGLVDDDAMATALVAERRAKGHAPRRLREDLRARGFDRATIDRALEGVEAEDPEASAFGLARDRAERLTGVDAETAVRRIVAHLARRGHPEGLARKVARQAVDVSRDPQRTAGR